MNSTTDTTTTTATQIVDSANVNALVIRYPDTIAVFNRFGIDSCCGGSVPVADAARRDGAEVDALIAALREVVARQ